MLKDDLYDKLVRERIACRRCEASGLTNPSIVSDGRFDSPEIGPWSRWQERVGAMLMIFAVAASFGSVRRKLPGFSFSRLAERMSPRLRSRDNRARGRPACPERERSAVPARRLHQAARRVDQRLLRERARPGDNVEGDVRVGLGRRAGIRNEQRDHVRIDASLSR